MGEIESTEGATRALGLRRSGHTYRDIADMLGVSTSTAHKWVSASLAAIPASEAAELRSVEGQRLDALQQAIWPAALDGDLAAVREVVRIIDRRARLYGLDAPTHIDVGVGDVDIAGTATRIINELIASIDDGSSGN